MKMTQLALKAVKKDFGTGRAKVHVLRGISTQFIQGKSYAITGVSGSGKSTLMHMVGGLEKPTAGKVFFNDQDMYALQEKKKEFFLNRSIGFVFQFHYLVKELSVMDNVMLPGLIGGMDRPEAQKRACKLLHYLGLTSKKFSSPSQLSGGEQQRVAIARALFNEPVFILADEPTGNLDAENARKIVDLFLAYQKEKRVGLIISSHDPAVYERLDTIMRLHDGGLHLQKGRK